MIIIGGNAAGMAAVMRARRNRPDMDITVIERSSHISSANCSIPDFLAGAIASKDDLFVLTPESVRVDYRINLLTNHNAIDVNAVKREISVQNKATSQEFSLPYDRLILATGASPFKPNWPNINSKGVFALRAPHDADALRSFIQTQKPRKIVVVGTGTIAQVCAAALHSYGLDIKMIGLTSGLMTDLESTISKRLYDTLANNNIDLYFTDNLYGIKVSLDNKVIGIEEHGDLHQCDMVLLAMGVTPNVDLADSASISLGKNGAITVDKHLKTSRETIYACGDCAETFHKITHKPVYWPLATTSARQGRQAGESASGGQGQDTGTLTTRIWTCFDLQVGRTGLSVKQAEEFGIKASKAEISVDRQMDMALIYDQNERLIGAQMAGMRNVHAALNTLAAAIEGKLTLREIEGLDLGYTPKLSTLWDPIQIAARQGRKQRKS
ncbi:FAD-dependent oxidoreductase [bacterium]|nr:FAD-dependent oxidoreductase [bacterium]